MTDAQRKLLQSADARGRIPHGAPRHTLRACKVRGWVDSRHDASAGLWLGDFVTDAGKKALGAAVAPSKGT